MLYYCLAAPGKWRAHTPPTTVVTLKGSTAWLDRRSQIGCYLAVVAPYCYSHLHNVKSCLLLRQVLMVWVLAVKQVQVPRAPHQKRTLQQPIAHPPNHQPAPSAQHLRSSSALPSSSSNQLPGHHSARLLLVVLQRNRGIDGHLVREIYTRVGAQILREKSSNQHRLGRSRPMLVVLLLECLG